MVYGYARVSTKLQETDGNSLQWFYSCFFIFMRTWSGTVKISLFLQKGWLR